MKDLGLLLLEQAPALIWRANRNAMCDWFNQTWLSFTGRTIEQERGNGWTEGIHPDDFLAAMKTYTDAFSERRRFEMEYRLRHHDGNYRWILDHGIPFEEGGQFGGYVGFCFDITDRKVIEDSLIRRTQDLEAMNLELVKARNELERIANHDQLTGLANRHFLIDRFHVESKRRDRSGKPIALLLIDLDHFKQVNDTYGHKAGDECLRLFAEVLLSVVRETDVVARYGGEEFIVLLPDTEILGAETVAAKICEGVCSKTYLIGDAQIALTLSAGGVSITEPGNVSFEELLQIADEELYRAKSEGRNRAFVRLATPKTPSS